MGVLSLTDAVATQVATAAFINANWALIEAEVNSLDATNLATDAVEAAKIKALAVTTAKINAGAVVQSKVDYTSANSGLLVAQVGPNYTSTAGGRFAMCSTAVVAATGAVTAAVNFSTAINGDPVWTVAPILVGYSIFDADTNHVEIPDKVWVSAVTTSVFTYRLNYPDTVTDATQTLHTLWWGAI